MGARRRARSNPVVARARVACDWREEHLPPAEIEVDDGRYRYRFRVLFPRSDDRRTLLFQLWPRSGSAWPELTLVGELDPAGDVLWIRAEVDTSLGFGRESIVHRPITRYLPVLGPQLDAALELYFRNLPSGEYDVPGWPDPPRERLP